MTDDGLLVCWCVVSSSMYLAVWFLLLTPLQCCCVIARRLPRLTQYRTGHSKQLMSLQGSPQSQKSDDSGTAESVAPRSPAEEMLLQTSSLINSTTENVDQYVKMKKTDKEKEMTRFEPSNIYRTFWTAVMKNDIYTVKKAISYKSDLKNEPNVDVLKTSPVHYCVEHKYKKMLRYFVEECKSDVNLRTEGLTQGNTPLHYACRIGDAWIIKLLLENGADVTAKTNVHGYTPLHIAAMRGQIESLKILLSTGTDEELSSKLGATNTGGDTLLHAAAANGRSNTCRFLINQGIAPNVLNCTFHTPLHLATMKSSLASVKAIVEGGMTKEYINYKNNEARTALHESVTLGNMMITEYLLRNGALDSINEKDFAGETPMHGAVRNKHDQIVKMLRQQYNANHTIRNTAGESPFSLALNQKNHNYSKCYDELKSRIGVRKKLEKEAKRLMRPKYVKRASLMDQSGNTMLSPEERNKKRTAKHRQAIDKMARSEARRAMFVSSAQSGLKGNYFIVG